MNAERLNVYLEYRKRELAFQENTFAQLVTHILHTDQHSITYQKALDDTARNIGRLKVVVEQLEKML